MMSSLIMSRGSGLAMAIALAAPVPVLAQAAPQSDAAAPVANSDIIVTGSRLRGEAPVGSTVTSLGTADIAASGRVTLDRAIKELPQVFDLGVSENSRGQSGGAGNIVYGNSINLRGIGPNATLIIIDGHRVTNNSRSVDPSVLPTLGVERVEIVADGASAIYGSDAVAGVVNLIPRRSLDGLEAFARAGVSGDGVYHEYSAGAAFGKKFSRGQFMVAYEHVEKTNLNGADRPFFTSNQLASGGNDYSTTRCAPGTIRLTSGTATLNSWAIPAGGVTSPGQLTSGTRNTCDDLQGQDLFPRQRYNSVNSTFTFEVTDWLSIFADGFYSKRVFERQPAYANAALSVPTTNAWFVMPTGVTSAQLPNCPSSAGTPSGTKCLTLDYNYSRDSARNTSFGYGESWQVTPGIRVKLPHDWQFEALVGKGRTSDNSSSLIGISASALAAALRSSDPATAFDPWGLYRTSGAVLGGIFNQVSINPTIGHFTGYEARVNGKLFDLPGGGVKLAAGYEGQEFRVELGRGSGTVANTTFTWSRPGRRVDSAYVELLIPVFGAGNAMPGFQKLEIDAAVRYDKYSDVGKTTNPKIGVSWMPVDRLTLRGSYGTSFRAPTLPQIYGNTNQLFVQTYQNPAGGTISGVARSGGNLNLKPETASTWSVGADFEPIPRLRLSATYFNVDYKNQVIALLSDLAVLSRLSQFNGTGLIIQGTDAAQAVTDALAAGVTPPTGTLPNPVTLFVDGRSQNLGRSITRGIDFTANYSIPTDTAGTFGLSLSGTYLTKYVTAQTPTAPLVDQLNQIFQPLRFKMRAGLTWEKGAFNAGLRLTHINGYTNTAITVPQAVKSYSPVDLNLAWKTGTDHQLIFGLEARNLFNVKPPYVNLAPSVNGSGGYDATTTDPIGRTFAASARVKW